MPQDEAETFQHYRVLRREDGSLWKLGAGAMGVTYKAIDTNLDAFVALKVINALYTGNDAARERFIREAKAAAGLRHRNVASVYHLGRDEQSFFYAMEFIDGETVEHFIKREGPQSWRLALPTVLQVTRALMAAHEKHIVHRDVKPANIMLVREVGEDDLTIKLIDFGLAKALVEEGGSVVNVSGSGFLGTPLYASPEQCEELAPDIRSDIYSLGVTLWFVLAGRPPFEGGLGKVFAQHLHAPLPWVQLPATLPGPVRALLTRMLAKNRADRPQTPTDLRREIETCLRACVQGIPGAAPMPVADLFAEPMVDPRVAEKFAETPAHAAAQPAPPEVPAAEPAPAGYSLEDALRRNDGRLPAATVANLLGPLAQIVDAAETGAPDLTPGGVWIVAGTASGMPPHGVPLTDSWLTEGEPGWLEVHPPDAARTLIPTGNETMPPARAGFIAPVAALAALAYELLDGAAPHFGHGYRPLSQCDEESNALLRRALEGGPGVFADAATFAAALGPSLRRRPAKAANALPPSLPATMPPEKRVPSANIVASWMAAILLVAVVGKLTLFPGAEPVAHPTPSPAPTPTAAPSLASPAESPALITPEPNAGPNAQPAIEKGTAGNDEAAAHAQEPPASPAVAGPAPSAATNPDVLTLDMTKIFASYSKTKDAEATINANREVAKKELDNRMESYKNLLDEINQLNRDIDNPALSATAKTERTKKREDKIQQIRSLETEINEFKSSREKQLQDQAVNMRSAIVDDIDNARGAILSGMKDALVFDKSGQSANGVPVILYSADSMDFSDKISTALSSGTSASPSGSRLGARKADDLNWAMVDMNMIFSNFYQTKDAEKRINEARAEAKKELDDRMAFHKELLDEINQLNKDIDNPALSATVKTDRTKNREDKIQQVRSLEIEINEFKSSREKQLQDQAVKVRNGIVEQITKVVQSYASRDAWNIILDKSGASPDGAPFVLYAADMPDLSDEVVTQLNNTQSSSGFHYYAFSPKIATIDVSKVYKALPQTKDAESGSNGGKPPQEEAAKKRNAVIDQIARATKDYALKNGFNLIFDSGGSSLNGLPFILELRDIPDVSTPIIETMEAH